MLQLHLKIASYCVLTRAQAKVRTTDINLTDITPFKRLPRGYSKESQVSEVKGQRFRNCAGPVAPFSLENSVATVFNKVRSKEETYRTTLWDLMVCDERGKAGVCKC